MAEKVLNLKLIYKDKSLDVIKYKRDFHNKVYIGNDKKLFWQILDKQFPQKHEFLTKKGSEFRINLRDEMSYRITKDNQELTEEELKRKNIIKKNKLILDPKTEGEIKFRDNWKIKYNFALPYSFTPSAEEIKLAKKFSHLPPLSPQQKFTRLFILLGILFTFIGLYIVELNYVPPKRVNLKEKLRHIEQIATKVEPVAEVPEEKQVARSQKEEKVVDEEVEQAQEMTSSQFEQEFGLSLESGMPGGEGTEDFNNELLEVTQAEQITVEGGTQGSGSRKAKAQRGAADLDLAGTSGYNLESAGDGLSGLGGTSGIDLGGSGDFEEVDMSGLSGKVGDYKIHKIQNSAEFKAVKKRFAGLKSVKAGSIKLKKSSPKVQSEVANIDQIVTTYKPQITKLFTTESMLVDMYGSIEFVLYIGDNGNIEAVEINASKNSSFTNSFLSKTRKIIMNWKIEVKNAIVYSFRMKFYK